MTAESTNSADRGPIHPGARIGHVHLKVADLERAIGFYRGVLGFELTQRYGGGMAVEFSHSPSVTASPHSLPSSRSTTKHPR